MQTSTSVAIVLKGYPRLSETFIAEEIHALERAGVIVSLFSLRHPTDRTTHPVHRAIRAPVVYLPEYLHREPRRVLRAWAWARRPQRYARYRDARTIWRRDLRREPLRNWRNRIRRFGQALVLAMEMPDDIDLLYAHFLHTPASVTRYAAALLDIEWSCSAHAKDIWTTPQWEIRDKLDGCRWLTTCTRANFDHLRALSPAPAKVALNYHGLDLSRLPQDDDGAPRERRDGNDAELPVRILSVGRAVGKKGYFGLLDALAVLPRALHWEFIHIGDGPLRDACRRRADELGIDARVQWLGAQPRDAVLERYRQSDLFALNCRIEADGDRDGLPNVLVEAQSQSLAVVATNISGIPELVEDGVNGLLVAPDDSDALRDALYKLIIDPSLRASLGDAGRAIVRERFDMRDNFARLLNMIVNRDAP